MDSIASAFLTAKTVPEVSSIINDLLRKARIDRLPVGGIDNNLATIGLGSDPAAGVIERVTNAIDAVIDREWMEQGEPPNIFSPRAAVEEWFAVPNGRLSEISKEELRRFDDIQSCVQVTLQDSGQSALPTVEIRDNGTGLKSEEFAESILGLNKNRKLKKLFLAGAFGQGGSTALAYSEYTIIASRAINFGTGPKNKVAITVVGFDRGNPEVDKHGFYYYLVDKTTGMPLTFDLVEEIFPCGTLVRHVAMQLQRYKAVMTAPTGSLWYLTHNYLFDPVLPFQVRDERKRSIKSNKGSVPSRSVTGNNRRLSRGKLTEYQNAVETTFRDGRVTIYYWVLTGEGENPRNRITNYCLRSQPIVVTFNGQKQGDFPNTVIKGDLKLPYLDSYLVVQVDCDLLDAESRRQLFPTTRESIRATEIGFDLRRLVQETLAGDSDLKRLDKERMKRLVTNIETSSTEKIRKRLSSRVKVFTSVGTGGTGPVISGDDTHGDDTFKKEPIPVQDPPTYLKITSAQPRKIYAGKKFTLNFETDARQDYFKFTESFIAVIDPPLFAQFTGTTRVMNGYGTVYFQAADDIAIGETAKVTLELRPPRSTAIGDSIEVEVIPLPDAAGTEGSGTSTPNINPVWVDIEHAFWNERGWDETAVAEVEQDEDAVTVFVSGENKQFSKLLARAQRHGEEAVDAIKNFYLEHIAFHSVIAEIDKTNAERDGLLDPEQAELQNQKELKHACETVCGIITSMFEVIVIEAEKEAVAE